MALNTSDSTLPRTPAPFGLGQALRRALGRIGLGGQVSSEPTVVGAGAVPSKSDVHDCIAMALTQVSGRGPEEFRIKVSHLGHARDRLYIALVNLSHPLEPWLAQEIEEKAGVRLMSTFDARLLGIYWRVTKPAKGSTGASS